MVLGLLFILQPLAWGGGWETEVGACRDLIGQVGLDACNKAIVTMPVDVPPQVVSDVYRNRGIIYGQMDRKDEALFDLKRAVKLDPHNVKNQYNLGVAYEETGHDWLALRAYREASNLDTQMTLAWANRALAAYRTERYQEACVAFEMVQTIEPSYFDTHEEHRVAWEESQKVKPMSVAGRREVIAHFSPNIGYLTLADTANAMPVEQFIFALLDSGVDVQIYRQFFATGSFIYGRTAFKAPSNGSLNTYGFTFGLKLVSRETISQPFLTFLDHSRFWFAAQVGPYIMQGSDSSGLVAVPDEVDIGANGGVGYEYYFHPNIAVGLGAKLNYIKYSLDDFVIFSAGPVIVGRF